MALIESRRQTLGFICVCRGIRQSRPGPFEVSRRRTVTPFATDVDLGPVGLESIGCRLIVLAQTGRMAVRAHEVPVLRGPRPMQLVVMRHALIGIHVKPTLAAL